MNQIIKSLEEKVNEQQAILEEVKQLIRDRDFYKRLVIQAILTSDGKLDIDPTKADEAFSLLHNSTLEFGNGKVCFHKQKHSIFAPE